MCICAKAGFSGSRVFIGVAFFACFYMDGSATNWYSNGLAYRSFRSFKDFGGCYQAFVLYANFERPNFRRLAVVVNCLLCNSICQVPVNVRVRCARRSECRRTTIVRMFIFICFFGCGCFAIDQYGSGLLNFSSRGALQAARRICRRSMSGSANRDRRVG